MASPSLEIHIPISPTDQFMRMTQYLVYSLRKNGGNYANAKIVLTIGEKQIVEDLGERYPWLKKQNVEVRWVPLPLFSELSYYATAHQRLCQDYESEMVLLMDADMLFASSIEDLVVRLHEEQKFAGLITHVPPFADLDVWQRLYKVAGLGKVEAIHQHTGWPYMFNERKLRYTPPYFNYGFIMMPASFARQIGEIVFDVMRKASTVVDNYYKCQYSLAMSLVKLGLPYECLPMRYNFANHAPLEALHGLELADARVLHNLANHQGVHKSMFASRGAIELFLSRDDLAGVNAKAQEIMKTVHAKATADWR